MEYKRKHAYDTTGEGFRYRVDIYEEGRLVVTHIFYGADKEEALEISKAHEESDKFYKAAVTDKDYEGIKLKVKTSTSGEDDKKEEKPLSSYFKR